MPFAACSVEGTNFEDGCSVALACMREILVASALLVEGAKLYRNESATNLDGQTVANGQRSQAGLRA
jgi:hypothetical protein